MVGLLLLGIVTTLGTLFAAHSDGGAQVVEDYYQKAVDWEAFGKTASSFRHRAKSELNKELLTYEETKGAVRFKRLMTMGSVNLAAMSISNLHAILLSIFSSALTKK